MPEGISEQQGGSETRVISVEKLAKVYETASSKDTNIITPHQFGLLAVYDMAYDDGYNRAKEEEQA